MKRKTIAKHIVKEILDEGLASSTFREHHPKAYDDLFHYRKDLELSVLKKLPKSIL